MATRWEALCVEKNKIGTSGRNTLICRAASMPPRTGIEMSRMIKSGLNCLDFSTASSPFFAWAHTSICWDWSIAQRPILTISWSSATNTRKAREGASGCMWMESNLDGFVLGAFADLASSPIESENSVGVYSKQYTLQCRCVRQSTEFPVSAIRRNIRLNFALFTCLRASWPVVRLPCSPEVLMTLPAYDIFKKHDARSH